MGQIWSSPILQAPKTVTGVHIEVEPTGAPSFQDIPPYFFSCESEITTIQACHFEGSRLRRSMNRRKWVFTNWAYCWRSRSVGGHDVADSRMDQVFHLDAAEISSDARTANRTLVIVVDVAAAQHPISKLAKRTP